MRQSPDPKGSLEGVSGGLTLTQPSLEGVSQQVRPCQTAGELAAWCSEEALRVLGAGPHQPPTSGSCPSPRGDQGCGHWDVQALDFGISRLWILGHPDSGCWDRQALDSGTSRFWDIQALDSGISRLWVLGYPGSVFWDIQALDSEIPAQLRLKEGRLCLADIP